jgi:CRISPR-associated endonuclease/helicase Cas3
MGDVSTYFRYWGKAKPDGGDGGRYHLLPYHCFDVAAVGWFLLAPDQPLCQRLARQLGVAPDWLQQFFCFCLMLHDLGKFARAFQNLAPSLSPSLVPYVGQCVYSTRHDTLGFMLWKKQLAQNLSGLIPADIKIEPWLEVVCGHHGQPPKRSLPGLISYFMPEDERAAEAFVVDVAQYWLPDLSPLRVVDKNAFRAASWQLAGVAVLADWLGSDQSVFHYCDEPRALEEYWDNVALPKAGQVLAKAQISMQPVSLFESIGQQFPFIKQSTPLQAFAAEVPLASGPQLFILEDVTGAGKTEAAMVLCQRMMSQGSAKGLYVALPTMATANGMYERLVQSYRALFSPQAQPSLVLAHGARELSDGFVASVTLSSQLTDSNYDKDESSASAYCNAWLADSRKKALLADVGVGTIDQALLAVLPARHQSLRLLGLSDKILLVDEVHAYDPYMQRLLTALLEAHARQGGSAILLSATLPQKMRETLSSGFAAGLSVVSPTLTKFGYPLLTHCSAEGVNEAVVATRESVHRQVSVRRLDNEAQALEQIHLAVQAGRCICWIRNTVKDARAAFSMLQQQTWLSGDALTLFHSRFAMVDRQAIEKDVLNRFGKSSVEAQRAGQVLIATQVVEQSLDLDFDEMISDLAPIDLLIQRAGRLQRHNRNLQGAVDDQESDSRPQASLSVLAPDPEHVVDSAWLKTLLPGTQAVYANVGQLWLTLNVLMQQQGFAMPEDARHLIEAVYSDEAQYNVPEPLRDASSQAVGVQKGERSIAELNRLRLEKGYTIGSADTSGGWAEEVRIPTRLSAESVSVAVVRVVNGELIPYAENDQHAWALSQLSLPEHEWQQVCSHIPQVWQIAIDALKEKQPALRWLEILPLTDELAECYSAAGGWLGVVK